MVSAYAIPCYLLEVYKTDEENFEPYTPKTSNDDSSDKDKKKKEEEKTEEEDGEEEEEVEENEEGFTLHQGEIQEIYYYPNLHTLSWDHDYEELSNNGSCEIPYHETDLKQCYLGVRLCLRVDWEEYNETRVLKELPEAILGFITEERFSNALTELTLSGMDKLTEKEYQFEFTQMKRSEIIIEMIKTAGLIPEVDVTGLQDDIIDYSNISSSGDDDSGSTGGEGADIDSLVKKIIKGKKGALAKAQAIHEWLKQNVRYGSYSCSQCSTPAECLKKLTHLNCADTARLTRAMMSSAGLKAYVAHHSQGPGHFWTIIEIKGVKYASDQTGSGSAWNTVWYPSGRTGAGTSGGNYDRICGDNPSC